LLEVDMLSPGPLRVTVEPLEDALLIRAAGEIDISTVVTLRRELEAARDEVATALLDLSAVTFLDSTGLHLLLEASRDSVSSEWGFFILRPSEVVQRVIDVSRTADLLTLVDPAAARVLG
jgi:anti-sigma B factor antagonist